MNQSENLYLPIRFYEPDVDAWEQTMREYALAMAAASAIGNREAADNWYQAILELQHQQDLRTLDRIERQRECYFDTRGVADRQDMEATRG